MAAIIEHEQRIVYVLTETCAELAALSRLPRADEVWGVVAGARSALERDAAPAVAELLRATPEERLFWSRDERSAIENLGLVGSTSQRAIQVFEEYHRRLNAFVHRSAAAGLVPEGFAVALIDRLAAWLDTATLETLAAARELPPLTGPTSPWAGAVKTTVDEVLGLAKPAPP